MKRGSGLLTIGLGLLLGLLASPVWAEVPDNERVLITDPALLESMGFPFDARNVYTRTATGVSREATRDFGIALDHFSGLGTGQFVGRENITGSWQYQADNFDLTRLGTESFANGQVIMPTGVVLTGFRWWATDVNAAHDLAIFFEEVCLPAFSAGNLTHTILASTATSGSSGNQSAFVGIPGHTVDNVGCVYVVRARFDDTTGLVLQKVRAQWNRQVSPAPATATFNDVPTGHPFFQFVEALAASGITSGCNVSPPLYCPDNAVTRGQMAAFFSKALGLTFP